MFIVYSHRHLQSCNSYSHLHCSYLAIEMSTNWKFIQEHVYNHNNSVYIFYSCALKNKYKDRNALKILSLNLRQKQ